MVSEITCRAVFRRCGRKCLEHGNTFLYKNTPSNVIANVVSYISCMPLLEAADVFAVLL
jgi:hypothetical protein